jgi:Gpi18-like mannosyltransferase
MHKFPLKNILLIFLFWLIAINLFSLLALNRLNLQGDTAYDWIINSDPYYQTQGFRWNELHAQWDSFWLLDVAQNGYYLREGTISNVVFFPLYPLLIKLTSFILLGDFLLAGWLLSALFLLGALIYLFKLAREFHPEIKDPYQPLLFLLVFPTAIFFNAVYTEAIFLFLSVAAIFYTRQKKYPLAGTLGFLAALTRITGLLIFIPLLWEALRDSNFKLSPFFQKKRWMIFLAPLGTFSFFLFHYFQFGDFWLFFKIQSLWGRSFELNSAHFELLNPPATVNLITDLAFVVLGIGGGILIAKKIRFSYGLYVLAAVLVPLSTGTLMSIGRYLLVLFPLYLLFASFKNSLLRQGLLLVSTIFLAYYTLLFVNHYWAG